MGGAGGPGARPRVGAGHARAGAGPARVLAAAAKGHDRDPGSERGAQPAALPGLHRAAGVPEGAHRHLVRARTHTHSLTSFFFFFRTLLSTCQMLCYYQNLFFFFLPPVCWRQCEQIITDSA